MDSGILAVLDEPAHGIPASEYVSILEDRLPTWDVTHPKTPLQRTQAIETATVITGKTISAQEVAGADQLRLFAAISAGVDHLPLAELESTGIIVTNASGVHGPGIAEHVIAWMLMFYRRMDIAFARQRLRTWQKFQSFGTLSGSVVAIVGLGSIGEAIARRLAPFNVELIGVRHSPDKPAPVNSVVGYEQLLSVLPKTDILVCCAPLTDDTRQIIDAAALAAMPTDAIVINVGRGGLVDTDALVDILQANQLHGAALDVTDPEPLPADHPLWTLDNVYLTPHVSGHTPEYFERCADILEQNLMHLEGGGSTEEVRNRVI